MPSILERVLTMKRFAYVFFMLYLILTFSCEKDREKEHVLSNNQVIGYWVNPVYTDSTITFDKATSLKENDYCFAFLKDRLFIERKNSGWCGTPPISFADYEGTWSKADNTIQIKVGYWGGLINYEWKIISVNDEKLVIKEIY
jgi:hypothetical protein